MTQTVQLLQYPDAAAPASPRASAAWASQVRAKAHRLGARIVAALNAWAVARADAALYEALSKMSDAQLRNLGLSRGELYRSVYGR
jgi:uncharacterized protein YjiS (DUF1127 family)